MHTQSYVTPQPTRQEFNHPQAVKVFLTSETIIAAVKRSNNFEFTSRLFDDVRKYLSMEDMAFAEAVHITLSNTDLFRDLVSPDSAFMVLMAGDKEKLQSIGKQISAFVQVNDLKTEVQNYLGLNPSDNSYKDIVVSDDGCTKPYTLHKLGEVLLVGVKSGFIQQLSKKEKLLDFYIDSLELCSYSLQGPEVRSSRLYSQFVKLSLAL